VRSEDLREALLAVERQRAEEYRARQEAEALLTGLRVLADAQGVQELFFGILSIVRDVVPFSDAAVLIAADDRLATVVATSPVLGHELPRLPITGVVHRALMGRPVVVADLSMIPEWAVLSDEVTGSYASAILLPVGSRDHSALFVCLHADRAAFSRHQLAVMGYFMPLAAQAIQRSREIEQLDGMISRLEHLAHHDVLTGLGNRALFSTRLDAAISRAQQNGTSVGIVHLDMDDFKVVNDTMGHGAGDSLLEMVGDRLRHVLRGIDGVARIGGDEFAVVLSDLSVPDEAVRVAERLLAAVAAPFSLQGRVIRPGLSIGVATYPEDGHTAQQVLACADIALYGAKAAGGSRVSRFQTQMRAELEAQDQIERDLRRGLEAGEIRVMYQPILRADDRVVIGLEALVRWQHPDRGLLMPATFITVAERSDLVCALGHHVLRQALHDTADWILARPERRLSVNVAARQLLVPTFAEDILGLLRRHDLPPNVLELELSEEIVARRTVHSALDMLRELDALGVQFAFDDFGTGYSSMVQLRTFPGHRLKIDRSFVSRMLVDEADSAVVHGLINLAHGLRLQVVAEGVETTEQAHALLSYGCDELQGFYFSRPIPIPDVVLADWVIHPDDRTGAADGAAAPAQSVPKIIAPRGGRRGGARMN
jgi:diguanylate cyclase (GGDEF)-like protein